ncbi:ferredoxin reductase-like C-terminal NADP-linked domain-containing protein [Mycena floridula]|nr:ferredoxin reductase-like C-terminal NADP-linked domain-containing protein [Mycena floridula]
MPNKNQVLFLASFLFTFALLVACAHVLNSKFHFARLILLGLPKDTNNPNMGNYEINDYLHVAQDFVNNFKLDDLKAVQVPYIGPVDFIALASSPTFVFTASVIVATFIWTKVIHSGRTKVLDPKVWLEFPLAEKIQMSPNTAVYRFALPREHNVLGLPVGQHISVSAEINGKEIMRSYTPISSDDEDQDRGHFDLLIKTYERGNISKHFSLLKIGDKVRVKGPKGNFQYHPTLAQHIGMIAGGTGITPMIQIMKASLKNPFDKTTISLIYANVNEEDILLKDELATLLDVHGHDRLKIYYVLNNPPANWKGGVGFVSKEHIQQHLPLPTSDCKVLMCGPPPMMTAMKKHLDDLKYRAPRTVSKLADQVFLF